MTPRPGDKGTEGKIETGTQDQVSARAQDAPLSLMKLHRRVRPHALVAIGLGVGRCRLSDLASRTGAHRI